MFKRYVFSFFFIFAGEKLTSEKLSSILDYLDNVESSSRLNTIPNVCPFSLYL